MELYSKQIILLVYRTVFLQLLYAVALANDVPGNLAHDSYPSYATEYTISYTVLYT